MGVSDQHHAPGGALHPGKRSPVPIVQEAGWAPEPVWTQGLEEKSSASVGGRPLRSQTIYWLIKYTSILWIVTKLRLSRPILLSSEGWRTGAYEPLYRKCSGTKIMSRVTRVVPCSNWNWVTDSLAGTVYRRNLKLSVKSVTNGQRPLFNSSASHCIYGTGCLIPMLPLAGSCPNPRLPV
jgi:hypothetical protein